MMWPFLIEPYRMRRFEAEGRSYLTIAIGCTGGQHRSVYLVESLIKRFNSPTVNVIVRHREIQ